MDFVTVVAQVTALLRQRGRVTYRTLQRQFQLDEAALEDVKEELICGQCPAGDEDGRVLVWTGAPVTVPPTVLPLAAPSQSALLAYTPATTNRPSPWLKRSACVRRRRQP